ncbi:uncharacterized protein TNCV_556471 [Trichonephila clavipes]|uniref:Mos1 transposase HTH domain-containing protein n=1 Tax=Trichonephila clavipes TaxID=2585209 RepID=A0A8X6V6W8_TRICX|nr:uncharacterized protein TNCV_556471 [Trichonephila clavipes]
MSAYEPNSLHLREVLVFCFNMKITANEAHRTLSNNFGVDAITERTCREWFQHFKNGDFDVEDQHGIWWDQLGVVYYELLKPTETIAGYLSMTEKMPPLTIRTHYEKMSKFERGRIIGLNKAGWKIARHMGRSDAAIRRCLQEWMDNGIFQHYDSSGQRMATGD